MPSKLSYREVFFGTYGLGQFKCYFCGEPVEAEEVLVHHVDHDRTNNFPLNLTPAHRSCHTAYHKKEWWAGGNSPAAPYRMMTERAREQGRRSWDNRDREVAAQTMRDLWADPVWAERQRQKLRDTWARRKQTV